MSVLLKISEAANIAIHAAIAMAYNPKNMLTTKEIASKFSMNEHHLSKVLQRLTKEGYVKATRGPKGGFRLNRDPKEISLWDILQAIDGRIDISETTCLFDRPACSNVDCILEQLLSKINRETSEYLSGITLDKFS